MLGSFEAKTSDLPHGTFFTISSYISLYIVYIYIYIVLVYYIYICMYVLKILTIKYIFRNQMFKCLQK